MSVLLSVNKISTDYSGTHSIDQAGNRPIFLHEEKKKPKNLVASENVAVKSLVLLIQFWLLKAIDCKAMGDRSFVLIALNEVGIYSLGSVY